VVEGSGSNSGHYSFVDLRDETMMITFCGLLIDDVSAFLAMDFSNRGIR